LSIKLSGLVQSAEDPVALLHVINNVGRGVRPDACFSPTVQILRNNALYCLLSGQWRVNRLRRQQQEIIEYKREVIEYKLGRKQQERIEDQLVAVTLELGERQLTEQLFQQASVSVHLRKLATAEPETLRRQLKDKEPLIRLLAVMMIGRRHLHLEADLIECLKDPKSAVRVAAHRSLVRVARGTDFGPASDATAIQRDAAIKRWRDWLAQQDTSPGRR